MKSSLSQIDVLYSLTKFKDTSEVIVSTGSNLGCHIDYVFTMNYTHKQFYVF